MRKLYFAGALFGVLNFAQADPISTVNAPSSLIGKNALNAKYAYLWSVPVAAQDIANSTITSATITFTGVAKKGGKGNDINVDVGSFMDMSVGQSGVPTAGGLGKIKDKDVTSDAFDANVTANKAVNLGTQLFPTKKTLQTWSYTFTGTQLDALASYIAAGNWGFEIDPDGKFSVGGVSFSYTTEINGNTPTGIVATVPDTMSTLGLLGASFLGLVVFRRRLCLN